LWTRYTIHLCTQLSTGLIMAIADAEVKFLEHWNIKPFA
jgi:hypothetical protein